jgi:hypothetical protein
MRENLMSGLGRGRWKRGSVLPPRQCPTSPSSAPRMRRGKRGLPITGGTGKWRAAERKSEGAVVVPIGGTTQPTGSEGPLLHRCEPRTGRDPGECRIG